MACMLLLAACDNYLDIQPTGSVIPNSLAEYRALLARSYKDVSKFSDRGMACFRSDEMQVRDNEYDQNYYMDIISYFRRLFNVHSDRELYSNHPSKASK